MPMTSMTSHHFGRLLGAGVALLALTVASGISAAGECTDLERDHDVSQAKVHVRNDTGVDLFVDFYKYEPHDQADYGNPKKSGKVSAHGGKRDDQYGVPRHIANTLEKSKEQNRVRIKVVISSLDKSQEFASCEYEITNGKKGNDKVTEWNLINDGVCSSNFGADCKNCTISCEAAYDSSENGKWVTTFKIKPPPEDLVDDSPR